MRGVPHYLLDVADPKKQFTVAEYQERAKEKIEEVLSRGMLPIICGGTGLYVDSLLKGVVFPKVSPNARLRARLQNKTSAELFALLQKCDPRRAQTIDSHNPRRLIRAIEIAYALGSVPPLRHSNILENVGMSEGECRICFIGLTLPAEKLKRKISVRLFARIRKYKMVEEIKRLQGRGLSWKRMEELGLEYRYVSRYLRGLLTKKKMCEDLETEIWRYAKRQMTWFKRNKGIRWFPPNETEKIEEEVRRFLSA